MSNNQFKILSEKLDVLIKLTAINALKGKSLTEQVEILSEIGLQPKNIATILGTDRKTVSTLKGRTKKRKSKKTKNRIQQGGE
jgi:transcriptional regulator